MERALAVAWAFSFGPPQLAASFISIPKRGASGEIALSVGDNEPFGVDILVNR